MLRFISVALLLTAGSVLAQPAPGVSPSLTGRLEGQVYISPVGTFRMTSPVLPELGGSISDTSNVVTFQDQFNVHVSIAAFPQDATQRWELSTRGLKDYLSYFFDTFVMSDFQKIFPSARVEGSSFDTDMMGGALVVFTLLPGGSMFGEKHAVLGALETPPVAKRGNLLFVHDGVIYIVSTELAERVLERSTYKKTPEEEDVILRQRLADILKKIEFTKPASDR